MENDTFVGVENHIRDTLEDETERKIFNYLTTIRDALSKISDMTKNSKKMNEIFDVRSSFESTIYIFEKGIGLDKKAHYITICLNNHKITKKRVQQCFSTKGIRDESRKKLLVEQYNLCSVAIDKIMGWVEYQNLEK